MNIELKDKNPAKTWKGVYKGINFEIVNWTMSSFNGNNKSIWNYYIYLQLDKIPEESNPESYWLKPRYCKTYKMAFHDYCEHPVIGKIYFYGGITYYKKTEGFDKQPRIIKIGCDYNHIWDEGKAYNPNIILQDVKQTIDEFKAIVPNYKYHCQWDGSLHMPNEGILENESFKSFKNYTKSGFLRAKHRRKNNDVKKRLEKTIKRFKIAIDKTKK